MGCQVYGHKRKGTHQSLSLWYLMYYWSLYLFYSLGKKLNLTLCSLCYYYYDNYWSYVVAAAVAAVHLQSLLRKYHSKNLQWSHKSFYSRNVTLVSCFGECEHAVVVDVDTVDSDEDDGVVEFGVDLIDYLNRIFLLYCCFHCDFQEGLSILIQTGSGGGDMPD